MVISYKLPRVQEDTIMPQLRLERIQQGGQPSRRCRSLVTGSNRRWAALRLCGFAGASLLLHLDSGGSRTFLFAERRSIERTPLANPAP